MADATTGWSTARFDRIEPGGGVTSVDRAIADETPVAIEINGLAYAVLMATPLDLEDLAYGFLLAERVIARAGEVIDVEAHAVAGGMLVRMIVDAAAAATLGDRVRHRASDSSCGLCGVESLDQAVRPLPPVAPVHPAPAALFRALSAMRDHQPLNRATGAAHAALACAADGRVRLAREDVGRHNAFDKLNGAMLRAGLGWGDGFALLSSRCSYELVEKAVLAGCGALATVSAPTGLAVARARAAGLTLLPLARDDAVLHAR